MLPDHGTYDIYIYTIDSPRLVDHVCGVSDQSRKPFRRRFLKVYIFNPIWLPNHVTYDIINLHSASNWVVDRACEVSW